MNINKLSYNTILTRRADNSYSPRKQVSFGKFWDNPITSPQHDSIESLYINRPAIVPYSFAQKVFIPNKDIKRMNIPGDWVKIKSGGVDLHSWYIPPKPGKDTVLFCHGNGINLTHSKTVAKELADGGYGVLMVEYEGYGKNKGTPTEKKLYQNAKDAAKWLNNEKGTPNNNIILIGHSLGGPVAANTAASVSEQNHYKALILDSTIPNMATLIKSWIDKHYIVKINEPKKNYTIDRIRKDLQEGGGVFETDKAIPNIPKRTKILVIHSVKDNLVDKTVGEKTMRVVKRYRPDSGTYWDDTSNIFHNHQNYIARMDENLDFISSIPLQPSGVKAKTAFERYRELQK